MVQVAESTINYRSPRGTSYAERSGGVLHWYLQSEDKYFLYPIWNFLRDLRGTEEQGDCTLVVKKIRDRTYLKAVYSFGEDSDLTPILYIFSQDKSIRTLIVHRKE